MLKHGHLRGAMTAVSMLLCAHFSYVESRRVEGFGLHLASRFSCPSFCQECCKSDNSQVEFRCVLRRPASASRGPPAHCTNSSDAGAVTCPFSAEERRHQVWATVPNLQWGCSARLRCCCSASGLAVCAGDATPKERLIEAYNLSASELPALSERNSQMDRYDTNFWGCPAGFADYDAAGSPCRCSGACEDSPAVPVPAPRGLPGDAVELQVASLCAGVYTFESPVAGWELVKAWEVYPAYDDRVGIYRKRLAGSNGPHTCALVFTGTDTPGDALDDGEIFNTNFCGFEGIHMGFAGQAENYMQAARIEEFRNYLESPLSCGGGVVAAGHSLGGSIATLIAACWNKKIAEGNGPHGRGFDALYTLAAPSVSKEPLGDALSKDGSGCFQGGRFFNQDVWFIDPVPSSASWFLFKHPKISEFQIKELNGSVTYVSQECNGTSADKLQDPVRHWYQPYVSDPLMHLTSTYIRRMQLRYLRPAS